MSEPVITSVTRTEYIEPAFATTAAVGGYSSGVIGPNAYGVPENYPLLAANATCRKCHGTGYKKTLLTRKFKPCSKCSRAYGTDISRINLDALPVTNAATFGTMGTSMPMMSTLPTGFKTLPANP